MVIQGGTEPRKYEYDLVGDFEPKKAVTDKDAMDVKALLNKAGIEADGNQTKCVNHELYPTDVQEMQ